MRALCWNGINDLRVERVRDPEIVNPRDVILRVTMSTTCGSDLHFIDGYIPSMREGDVIGHEFMGEVVEVGREVKKINGRDLPPGRAAGDDTALTMAPMLQAGCDIPQSLDDWSRRLIAVQVCSQARLVPAGVRLVHADVLQTRRVI